MTILATGTSFKTIKSDKSKLNESITGIVYLAPASISGKNVCGFSSPACRKACLNTSGRGQMSNVQKGRLRKTLLFLNQKDVFFNDLNKDIEKLKRKCAKTQALPCVRLNGTSDIPFQNVKQGKNKQSLMHEHKDVQFYDYTKDWNRKSKTSNYHLTYSKSELHTEQDVQQMVEKGNNVAVVFRDKLPKTYAGQKVFSGDDTDLRFLDPVGVVVGLTAKGKAKFDVSGFVVD
tara:strand:+ start:981 stop:1676 length:696 start_codon:yes stop_codon:yes gene_type:complete